MEKKLEEYRTLLLVAEQNDRKIIPHLIPYYQEKIKELKAKLREAEKD